MRLFIVCAALVVSLTTSAAAQSRWTVSAGPEWGLVTPVTHLWGFRVRAEYDLTRPSSAFGLRLEGGTRWSPTQSYFFSDGIGTWAGTEQKLDVMVGLNASLSPMPRARVSPFVSFGVFGRQTWVNGSKFFGLGSPSGTIPDITNTRGDIIASLGVGARVRLGGRSFQLELRRLYGQNGFTFGTRLPF
jgi:outer membrane protein with beta-barrel domain